MIEKLIGWWVVNDPLPKTVDVIAVISYGATQRNMTKTSSMVTNAAVDVYAVRAGATIVWGEFSKNPVPSIEMVARGVRLTGYEYIFAGKVSSTTDECTAMKKALADESVKTENIVVVGEGCHSRRAKRVWEYNFPNSKICFRSVDPRLAADPKNPMIFQRRWWTWFLVNLILYPLYLGNGVKRMEKLNLSQPAS